MVLAQVLTVYCCDLDWHQFQISLSFLLILESKSIFEEDSTSFLQELDFLSETDFHNFVSSLKSLSLLTLSLGL